MHGYAEPDPARAILPTRLHERIVRCHHTNEHPMISPDVFDSINDTGGLRSEFGHCVVRDSHVDYILMEIVNRSGCIGCVPLDRERGGSLLLSRAMV